LKACRVQQCHCLAQGHKQLKTLHIAVDDLNPPSRQPANVKTEISEGLDLNRISFR